MSQEQYAAIHKSRLIDLKTFPPILIEQYIREQPSWLQPNITRLITIISKMHK